MPSADTLQHAPRVANRRWRYEAWHELAQKSQTGVVQARSEEVARRSLRARGYVIKSIEVAPETPFAQLRWRRKIAGKNLLPFYRQLAVEQKAERIPLNASLERMAASRTSPRTAELAADLVERLQEGQLPGEAFRAHTSEIGPLAVALVGAADDTGNYAREFERLADITERQMKVFRAIRKALSYPVMVLLIATVVVVAMMIFIVPTFEQIFSSLGGKLPLPTRITIAISGFGIHFWYVVLLALVAAVGAAVWAWRDPHTRMKIDALLLQIPRFGPFMLEGDLARSLAVLATLLDADLSLVDVALPNTAEVTNRRIIGEGYRFVATQVANGREVYAAMQLYNESLPGRLVIFPDAVVELAESAIVSGRYAELFGGFARALQEKVEAFAETIQTVIEPVLIVVLGAIVGFVVISLYLPMFDYITLVQRLAHAG